MPSVSAALERVTTVGGVGGVGGDVDGVEGALACPHHHHVDSGGCGVVRDVLDVVEDVDGAVGDVLLFTHL